jgi:hypothetical protein
MNDSIHRAQRRDLALQGAAVLAKGILLSLAVWVGVMAVVIAIVGN